MKAAYVTTYDSTDAQAWSGLGLNISRCLESAGIVIERVGPLERRVPPLVRLRQVGARLQRQRYPLDRDHNVAADYSRQVARCLDRMPCDLVFSPGTIPIAYLRSDHPVAIWADATFAAILPFYPSLKSLSKRAIQRGMELDTRGLARASVAFYASDWAARSAVDDHGADPAKVEVLPFGANMHIHHDREHVAEIVRARPANRCLLLFVGVDWLRKGGDRAVEIARVLNYRGLPTELHVVGCEPRRQLPPWVHVHGFVDKSTASGAVFLQRMYEQTHVLVHPASSECFGVVFCEAAAHGVLSVASRVGGIPSAVRDGITGALFSTEAPVEEYAEYIWHLLEDRDRYDKMAVSAFDEYQRALSWDAHAKRVGPRLAELLRAS